MSWRWRCQSHRPRQLLRLPAQPTRATTETKPTAGAQKNAKPAEPTPVVAISIKDREAVARLIPKIVESLGFKGANLFAQTERRDGVEIVSYGNIFVYAFVDNFLVVSADAAATRQVVDSYLNHQTLSSNSHFRNFTRWQPRQVLGQVYIAPGLVEQYNPIFGSRGSTDQTMSDYLSRVNPVIDPLTYALSNDGQGPLHELHIPRNLLTVLVAGFSNETAASALQTNQVMAQNALRTIASAEVVFMENTGEGRYGTLDELALKTLISKDYLQELWLHC